MKKLSHKGIFRVGEMLNGIKLEKCNIHTFENAEHYISRLEQFDKESGVCCDEVNEIIAGIKKACPNAKGCRCDFQYYACGVYGCIGKLSKVTVLNGSWEPTNEVFYIYF